jgi:Cu-Zn family superoxide dismutase
MRHIGGFAVGVVVFGISVGFAVKAYSTSPEDPPPLRAHAIIQGAAGSGILGEAILKQGSSDKKNSNTPVTEVDVEVHVKGLPQGKHGFHIHDNGSCTPTFAAAGGHFDGQTVGSNPDRDTTPDTNHPYHMGDLPNLEADENGEAHLHYTTSRITLSPGPLSLFAPNHPNGAAVIIHVLQDLGEPGVPNNAGDGRIACGVVIPEF